MPHFLSYPEDALVMEHRAIWEGEVPEHSRKVIWKETESGLHLLFRFPQQGSERSGPNAVPDLFKERGLIEEHALSLRHRYGVYA